MIQLMLEISKEKQQGLYSLYKGKVQLMKKLKIYKE